MPDIDPNVRILFKIKDGEPITKISGNGVAIGVGLMTLIGEFADLFGFSVLEVLEDFARVERAVVRTKKDVDVIRDLLNELEMI